MLRMSDSLLDKFNKIEKKHWWWEGRRELLKITLKDSYPERILDVGCGTGETLTFLKKIFPKAELYGIDTSSKAVRYSKERGHKNIQVASATKLPYKNSFFDAVLFLDVLEHIQDHSLAIKEAKRVLKRGGLIIITAPALSFIWSEHDTMQGHKRRYTRREIKRLAKDNGLDVEFIGYFNFLLSLPIIIIRLLSRLNIFRSFTSYDRGVNYEIANVSFANSVLKFLFVNEIRLLKFVKYPIGISVSSVLKKPNA